MEQALRIDVVRQDTVGLDEKPFDQQNGSY